MKSTSLETSSGTQAAAFVSSRSICAQLASAAGEADARAGEVKFEELRRRWVVGRPCGVPSLGVVGRIIDDRVVNVVCRGDRGGSVAQLSQQRDNERGGRQVPLVAPHD